MNWMPEAIRDGIIVVLVISGPLVVAAAIIGLIIGILQAATQVQEQTIGSAVKIIGVFILIIALGLWMFKYLSQYTSRTLSSAFTFIPNQTRKVIPRSSYRDTQNFKEERGTELPQKTFKLIEPEKIESELPKNPPSAGTPLLGSPKIPQTPPVTELLPPPPNLPMQNIPAIPKLPLSDIQLMPLPPTNPNQNEDINGELINIVPGKQKNTESKSENKLWQRKELFSYIINENNKKENRKDNASWLN